jgi:poly-gamma-glutamate synthesis protein (capsule biosynthesis protein)
MKRAVIISIILILGLEVSMLVWLRGEPNTTTENQNVVTLNSSVAQNTNTIAEVVEPPSWDLTIVGDIMLDRNVWGKIQQSGAQYPFEKITDRLTGDVVLGNLEGPFTSSTQHAVTGGSLLFTFDESLAPSLRTAGFTTLLLGNNHTLNHGQSGLDNTRALLTKNGLEYYGDPKNRAGYTLTKTLGDEQVTFIGYDNLDGTIDTVLTDVRAAHSKGEYVIVTPHWGAEYQLGIQPRLQQQAHQLIDAGADMILGGHPHVVEPFEIYQDKLIAYSLGNFIFDQYFSYDTQEQLLLNLSFEPSTIRVTLVPLTSIKSQPQLASTVAKEKLLTRLAKDSVVTDTVRNDLRQGSFTLTR